MNKNRLLTKEEFGKGIQECIDKVKNEMERDEIIRMAVEADLFDFQDLHEGKLSAFFPEDFSNSVFQFAALVAAHEREACAKVCDRLGDETEDANAADCAEAIRARGHG